MHKAWHIAPAPALFVTVAGDAFSVQPNAAADAHAAFQPLTRDHWQALGEAVHAAGDARQGGDEVLDGEHALALAAGPMTVAWQAVRCGSGWLAWLRPPHLPAAHAAPAPQGAPAARLALANAHSQQLLMVVDLVGLHLWRIDLRTGLVQLDPRTCQTHGLDIYPEGVPVQTLRALVHPEDVERLRTADRQALASDALVDAQVRMRALDGEFHPLLTRRLVQRDAQGEAIALVGVSLDMSVSERERSLKAAISARMDLVAEATGIAVWWFRHATGERHWNGSMRRLFSVPDAAVEPSLRKCLQACVLPEDWPRVLESIRLVERLDHPEADPLEPARRPPGFDAPGSPGVIELEFRIRDAAGRVRWLVSRTQALGVAAQAMAQGVFIDVTEFREAQVELRLAQSRVELAARAAGLGTWEHDLTTGRTHWDAQMYRLRGLSPTDPRPVEQLTGEMTPGPDAPDVRTRLAHALATGQGYVNEFKVLWPDGRVRWLASRGMSVAGWTGQLDRVFGVNWDITEHKLAEAMQRDKRLAEEASRAKTEFLARMSHELRTPLNAVLGFADLLCNAPPDDLAERERGHAELIRGAGLHLLALIDDVLELSQPEAPARPLRTLPVALDDALAVVVRWVQGEARQAGVSVQAAAGGLHVRADLQRLRQVLLNLLSNAVKYNRPGGWVQVRSQRVPFARRPPAWRSVSEGGLDAVMLSVTDSGRGMTAQQLAHLFEPFNRLGAESGPVQGMGIGLAIVRQLVGRLGGHVEVSSTPGEGSEFRVWLDAAPCDQQVGEPVQLPLAPMPEPLWRPDGLQALYVEDNPVNLLLMQEMFKKRPGWSLFTAVNGLDGVAQAHRLRPQLALIDMQLPDIDGIEVLRRLRLEPAMAAVPCIAVSANAMPDDIARARDAGFSDYWTKPVDLKHLLAALDTLADAPSTRVDLAHPAPPPTHAAAPAEAQRAGSGHG